MKAIRLFGHGLLLSGILAVTLGITGCQSSPPIYVPPPAGVLPAIAMAGPKFQVGDEVGVEFSGVDVPLLPHRERIKEDGNLTLPHIGPVKALGRTSGELQNAIRDAYVPDFYSTNLTVTVRSESLSFYVDGEVRSRSKFLWVPEMTVLKSITTAGGFTDFADRKRVRLTRSNGQIEIVNCARAINDPQFDMPVYSGDQIYVPRRFF